MSGSVVRRLIGVATVLALTAPGAMVHQAAFTLSATTTQPVTVSFTFDDTTADQLPAVAVLDQFGMHGTFFVNSPRVGFSPTYYSQAQLLSMQATGHEIAGHTLSHVDLATVSSDTVQHEICDDRSALLRMGFNVTSFAYPFGSTSSSVEQTVSDCGYESARGVGNLRSGSSCPSCRTAETIPARDVYNISTNTSVQSTTSLDTLESYVTAAENDQGGWIPLVIHHICTGCVGNTIDLDTFRSFVEWLAQRPPTTQVRTVHQVVAGIALPPPPPPPPVVPPVVAPPAPPAVTPPRPARLSVDASPEPVRRGRALTVRGRLTQSATGGAGARYVAVAGAAVFLQRRTLTGRYATIGTASTSAQGNLASRLKALPPDRCYRWVFKGSPAVGAVTSGRDCVHIRR